jgi:hypothetical protein
LAEDPGELRRLADWYRFFAEIGDPAARSDRLRMADYLERRAAELERRAANDPKKENP